MTPVSWGPADAPVIVLAVHGRGQDPSFMRSLSARFGPVPARFVAPVPSSGDSWYPLPFLSPIAENQPALDRALDVMEASLDGLDPSRVVLLGFSQGACLLAHLLLTRLRPVGAAVLLTGGYLGPTPLAPPPFPYNGMPVLLRSISQDPWVPASRVHETAQLLSAAGAKVDVTIAPGTDHTITAEACSAAAEVIRGLAS
ncbi:alpha/beta hydrolase [Amycolatopsis sp. NPDC004368]